LYGNYKNTLLHSYNSIGDEGVKALITIHESSKKIQKPSKTILQRLSLYNNDISDTGINAIIDALKKNSTINYVDITNNKITNKEALKSKEIDLLKLKPNIILEWD
jgi:hypothetical protein